MILIASGAYLQGEFASEVGLLPPSFLPIGNKRLYEHQIDFLKSRYEQEQDLYLSVPASYVIDDFDQVCLQKMGAKVLKVPDGLSLGDSLLFCWNATGKHYHSLTLLHGDTLFLNACFKDENVISVHANHGFYKRATLGKKAEILEQVHDKWTNDYEQVISGFFHFSDPLLFMKSLVEVKSDFIHGILRYHHTNPVILVSDGDWLDFGHINSFFHSRTHMTTQRAFNELNIGLRSISKSSKDKTLKIYAEGNWFAKLPLPLRLYTPALLDLQKSGENYHQASYQLEYLYLLPLSDLFVFSRLTKGSWETVFSGIFEMLEDFSNFRPEHVSQQTLNEVNGLYLPKTIERLNKYAQQAGFSINQEQFCIGGDENFTLPQIATLSAVYISQATEQDISIVHGDLCFSNMLFDGRVGAIKCIDPRGITPGNEFSLYGDRRYDLAKLYHSIVGFYDLIIAGRFEIEMISKNCININFSQNKQLHKEVYETFKKIILNNSGYQEKEILAITVHLFLSMLPLHSDHPERQEAFISNALRLFQILRKLD